LVFQVEFYEIAKKLAGQPGWELLNYTFEYKGVATMPVASAIVLIAFSPRVPPYRPPLLLLSAPLLYTFSPCAAVRHYYPPLFSSLPFLPEG
jgi:hypothetical protein